MNEAVSAPRRPAASKVLALCLLVLLFAAPPALAGGRLLDVRYSVQAEYTRVVLDLTAAASYMHRLELNPPRIVLEIPGGSTAKGLSPRSIHSPLVAGVRVDRLRGPSTLVVIDLARDCAYRTFALPAGEGTRPRIVVDVFGGSPAPEPAQPDLPAGAEGAEADPAQQAAAGPDPAQRAAAERAQDSPGSSEAIPATPETLGAVPSDGPLAAAPVEEAKIEEFVPGEALRVNGAGTSAAGGALPANADGIAGSQPPPETRPPALPPETEPPAEPSEEPPAEDQPPAQMGSPPPGTVREASIVSHPPRKRIVAIDAGHGGPDTGALRGKIEEKRICLDFATRLADAINAVDGYQAYLTRDGDFFLPLRRRYQLAEERGADIFVSIHANAARSRSAFGTEVFFLSLDGASDEAALELARKENESDQFAAASPEAEEDLTSIIRDLRRSDALRRSSFLAEAVLDELQEIPGVESRGVKQAGFTVLKSSRMPSILVETGFLSNAQERRLLTDPKYQQVFVHRIRDGLLGFFQKYGLAQP